MITAGVWAGQAARQVGTTGRHCAKPNAKDEGDTGSIQGIFICLPVH